MGVRLIASAVVDEQVVGGLPGGWFVTYNSTALELRLRSVNTPGTVTSTLGFTLVRPSGTRTAGVQSADGRLFALSDPDGVSDFTLLELYVDTGNVLTGTTYGTAPRATYFRQFASGDGLEYVLQNAATTTIDAYDTSAGTLSYSYDYSATAYGAAPTVIPAAGLGAAYGGSSFVLLDDAGATLDTLTYSTTGAVSLAASRDSRVIVGDIDGDDTTLRMTWLECAGGNLSIGPVKALTTSWSADVVRIGHAENASVIGPGTSKSAPYASQRLFTGRVPGTAWGAGDSSTLVGPGADTLVMAGPTYAVLAPFTAGTNALSTWAVTAGQSAMLRQRQSETRTPSRVRGVDLRQSQTPFIR